MWTVESVAGNREGTQRGGENLGLAVWKADRMVEAASIMSVKTPRGTNHQKARKIEKDTDAPNRKIGLHKRPTSIHDEN